jgi:hypothetical protein
MYIYAPFKQQTCGRGCNFLSMSILILVLLILFLQ